MWNYIRALPSTVFLKTTTTTTKVNRAVSLQSERERERRERESASEKRGDAAMDGESRHAGAPRTLDVQQFANARGAEVQSLHAVLKSRGQGKQGEGAATGGLPRHLRRRTTSHSRRRSFFWQRKHKVRKVGEVDAAETENKDERSAKNGAGVEGESQQEKEGKLPCRRVRRRIELKGDESGGGGCASDGTQRLVTHVWHAKRFTMTKIWGHWLAEGLPGR